MDLEQVKSFCEAWLPTWSGNRPEALIEFYAPDAFYSDPARPRGLRGRTEIMDYFRKLLARNPDWIWTFKEAIPTGAGFVLKWSARIPIGGHVREVDGLDIVEIVDGKISRNEVFFDRSVLS